MVPKLQILANVVERVKSINNPVTGYLYGIICNNTLTVLTFSISIPDDEEVKISHTTLQLGMPAEVYLCGVLYINSSDDITSTDKKSQHLDSFKDIDITDNPILLKYSFEDSKLEPFFYIHQKIEPVNKVKIISESDLFQQFTYVRLQGSFPFATDNLDIMNALQEVKKRIALGKVAIHLPSNDIYLFNNDASSKHIPLKELLHSPGTHESSKNTKDNTKSSTEIVDAVNANILLKISVDKLADDCTRHAPVLQHIKRTFNSLECNLNIDALSLVRQDISSMDLYEILVESACRNIKLIERSVKDDSHLPASLPKPMHFKPHDCGHLFTVTYPSDSVDIETWKYRYALHKALYLSMAKPCFRRGNAVLFKTEIDNNGPLINPHESVFSNEDAVEKSNIVQGLYLYYHYLQDGFDDNGWGCAYRSLQTIVSWYKLQGYTYVPVPSLHAIQKCLVDIGDKPSNFIGSKQWIGSTEVGFVLETLLNIRIKVLCASNGEEVCSFAMDLAHHFQTQGTPVMIGGGVLAHTILGVKINESSGDVKFLILDPHYVGPENLTTVINKGYCGWKTKDFWKKDAFYNMCLPQRPICI